MATYSATHPRQECRGAPDDRTALYGTGPHRTALGGTVILRLTVFG
ncbi:MAG: hypothetical protein R3275_10780 [Saprospiraceae bacterium]|nr:hypothetical protein [Saprospiraceae bacterium]